MVRLHDFSRKVALQFDRPGLRWLLASAYSLVGRLSPVGTSSLRYEEGGWVHRFGENYVVELRPRLRGAELSEEYVRDYCGQLYVPKPGDTIVDVGAGFGWESIFYARKVAPTGRVISIEAHPALAVSLSRSIKLNKLENVTVFNLALADRAQSLFIDNDLEGHRGNAVTDKADTGRIKVDALPLDSICADAGIDRIDFLKMNIEGAERLAIQGMRESVKRIAIIAISCHDFKFERTGNAFFQTRAIVEQWLREQGFVIVPREASVPWLRDQVNAYNPALVDAASLHGVAAAR